MPGPRGLASGAGTGGPLSWGRQPAQLQGQFGLWQQSRGRGVGRERVGGGQPRRCSARWEEQMCVGGRVRLQGALVHRTAKAGSAGHPGLGEW